jgi:hypothetical protein
MVGDDEIDNPAPPPPRHLGRTANPEKTLIPGGGAVGDHETTIAPLAPAMAAMGR